MSFTQEQLLYAGSHLLDEFAAEIGMSREQDESDPGFRARIKAEAFPASEDEAMKEYFGAIEAKQSAAFAVTLRDYFAGQALAGMFANDAMITRYGEHAKNNLIDPDVLTATAAYSIADAMISERSK